MRKYWIRLRGLDGHDVIAPNASRAKGKTFSAWRDAGYGQSPWRCGRSHFKQFLDELEVCHATGTVIAAKAQEGEVK